MTLTEALTSAGASLAAHKLRTALTLLGIVFGVGAVIAMLAIGAGAEREAQGLIESLGLSNVLVRSRSFPDEELQEIRAKSLGVSSRDAVAIAEAVPGVDFVAPRLALEVDRVAVPGGQADAAVVGVSHRHAILAGVALAEGRFLDARDEREHAQVAVLGPAVRRELFGYGPAVGEDVKAGDVWLRVIGVVAEGGPSAATVEGVSLGTPAREVYLPITTARRKFEHDPLAAPLSELVVHLTPDADARRAADQIGELLARLHAGAADYELVVPEALLAQSRRTQRLFNLVMGAIAGISLLVGGIGIMNILLATVLERTREIGLRRAVGARSRDIRFQFLIEAFAISLLGGLAGVVVGVALAQIVAAWAGWPTVVTATSVVLATAVATAVGLASGYYPASRAAQLDPVEALRYE